MTKFRKGDTVSIVGTIDTAFEHDGKIKVRIEPYSDVYANVADLTMVRPVINVGDSVTYPAEGYNTGTVLAIVEGYCWVRLEDRLLAGNPTLVSWPLACLNRVDPKPEPDTTEEAPPVEDAA